MTDRLEQLREEEYDQAEAEYYQQNGVEWPTHTCWEACSRCGGHGLVDGMYGPRDCPECGGNCFVRARDAKGRFTRLPVRRGGVSDDHH